MKETEPLSDNSHRFIERRPDARIIRSALDEVKAIRTLLDDVYKDVGAGRTLLRELVQNADDAEADRLVFAIIGDGWTDAQNSLLRGPALVVANNGPFPGKDRDALHQALGGSKAEEADKVGRFGVGLKSVFHICEAIVYVGADQSGLRPGALNPWAGTGQSGDADPLHPDWDSVGNDDLDRLVDMGRTLLGGFLNGLLLWIPLRQACHLDRAEDRLYGLGQDCPKPDVVAAWFERPEPLTLLLAQCGHLVSIEACSAPNPHELKSRHELAYVVRPNFDHRSWVGRYEVDTETVRRSFVGRIEGGSRSWSVLGVETCGFDSLGSLGRLRAEPDWPTDPFWSDGRCVWVSRKALAHAAITVLRPDNSSCDRCGVHLRWAVFFPLDNDPSPRSSAAVESVGGVHESSAWEIVLHGYFWPSHDRRSIPGVTDVAAGTGDGVIRVRWNQAVCDELLLPLLPSALADAVQDIPEGAARSLLVAVTSSQTVRSHLPSITRMELLLPKVTEKGVCWKAFKAEERKVLSIPLWSEAPTDVRRHFVAQLKENASDSCFIDHDAPRLGGSVGAWPHEWAYRLLDCISSDVLRAQQGLRWIESLLPHLLGSPSDPADSRTVAIASWLVSRIGEGALGPAVEGTVSEEQKEFRTQWLRVFSALPKPWLVSVPLAAQRAVAELARDGVIGAGLLPIPLGRNENIDCFSCPDVQRLDGALLKLGKRLLENTQASQRTRRARLLLAEALLSFRDTESLGEELSRLPLLRALRLPEDRDEAWSVGDLQRRKAQRRVFGRPGDYGDDEGSALDVPSDPKKAVAELAESVGKAMWLVDSPVAFAASVPMPKLDALALSVLSAGTISSSPEKRMGVLERFAKSDGTSNSIVHRAMISLLTGRVSAVGDDQELYYVRSQDSDRGANQVSLRIMLRILDKSWCEVETSLVEPLPHVLVESLCVKAVDLGVLHKLLQESLDTLTEWPVIDRDEAVHLLRRLHSNVPETPRSLAADAPPSKSRG